MKPIIFCFYLFFSHNLLSGEINKNKLRKTSDKMIKHIYIVELAKSLFSKETKINDFIDVRCTPDNKLNIWTCYIRQYVKFYDGNNYTTVDRNNNKWYLIIDFINEKYTITREIEEIRALYSKRVNRKKLTMKVTKKRKKHIDKNE